MKPTNLITDFLVIGLIAFVSLALPFYLFDENMFNVFLNKEIGNLAILIPVATAADYVIGIVFSQFSDFFLDTKIIKRLLFLNSIDAKENEVTIVSDGSYHKILQKIILKSENAYDYLSYRRTIIRIIRALIFGAIYIVFIHIIFSFICLMFLRGSSFSFRNFFIILFIIFQTIFLRHRYIVISKGYYASIMIFNEVIEESEKDE